MKRPLRSTSPLIAVLAVTSLLGACASGARIENMEVAGEPAQRIAPTPLRKQLAVRDVSGGNETNPLWKSNVGNPEFGGALRNSLRTTGLLAEAAPAHFALDAQLNALEQPMFGLDMTVTANVTYTLANPASGRTIWQKTLVTPYTAHVSDAFAGFERIRLANEGAIRANIGQLIDSLLGLGIGQLSLD